MAETPKKSTKEIPLEKRSPRAALVFVTYSETDAAYWTQFDKHLIALKEQELITIWNHSDLKPHDELEVIISERIKQADIIIILLSPDLRNDDLCHYELNQIKVQKRAILLPILVRPVDLTDMQFDLSQVWPKNCGPVSQLGQPPHDETWYELAQILRQKVLAQSVAEFTDSIAWPESIPARELHRDQIWQLKKKAQQGIQDPVQIRKIADLCKIRLNSNELAPDVLWNNIFTQAYNLNSNIKSVIEKIYQYESEHIRLLMSQLAGRGGANPRDNMPKP